MIINFEASSIVFNNEIEKKRKKTKIFRGTSGFPINHDFEKEKFVQIIEQSGLKKSLDSFHPVPLIQF